MSKIAIISDTHIGVRSGSNVFLDIQNQFFESIFFPIIKTANVDAIIHLGDLVDKRKSVDFMTSNRLKKDFLLKLEELNIKTHIITGNHDCFYKDTNEINALTELIEGKYQNIHIYSECTEILVHNTDIILVPWINSSNYQETLQKIDRTKSQICMGHLELIGFEMYKGYISDHGLASDIFGKFDLVLSGHYHQISSKQNVTYVGAPYHMTWTDYGNPRGFHIFDTDTMKLTFIENPYSSFTKIVYDDTMFKTSKQLISSVSEDQIKTKYCKLVVHKKTNDKWFESFVNTLHQYQPYDLKIIEQSEIVVQDIGVDQTEDTLTILKRNIENLETDVSKSELEKLMIELYTKSIEMDIQ